MSVMEATRTLEDTQGRASLNVWSAQCQGHCRRQHNTNKEHTLSPMIEVKVSELAWNRTRAAASDWEARTLPTAPQR